ncbi:MAG: sigma 54-interacting transcriptional regulator [Candidatus Solibacter usitatus]|nr:sigma 54-interacting transcriptional regulator [Candidatus Solibacter usitatus]
MIAAAGPLDGVVFPLEDSLSVGRDGSNTLAIDDQALSRRHCAIEPHGETWVLRDLDSRNGSYINGAPVRERVLEHGDRIRVGRSVFQFLAGSESSGVGWDAQPERPPGDTVVLRPEEAPSPPPQCLDIVLRLLTALPGSRGREPLERLLLESIVEVAPADQAVILLAGDQPGEFVSALSLDGEGDSGRRPQVSRTLAGRVMTEGVGILCNDISGLDDLARAASLRKMRIRSVVAVPLRRVGGVFGVVYLMRGDAAQPFTTEHLQVLTGLAGAVAAPLENALRIELLEAENQRLRDQIHVQHDMVGDGARMREVFAFVAKAAPSHSTVLVRGESGTGKELVARAIHRNSPRANRPFVAINCAALNEALLESELFGHERGAFTGAVAQKRGKLEEAHGGTLFLDEAGELAPASQAKLLRVLQEREFERVGGTRTIPADIRLVAATNRDLEAMVKRGEFRQDLYYRLNVVALVMPPLRERRDDIAGLAEHFVAKHARRVGRAVKGVSPEARAVLKRYDWPGNVRELENAIERALVLGSGEYVLPDDLPETVLEAGGGERGAEQAGFHAQVTQAKKEIVLRALDQAGGSFVDAARLLDLHPSNLHRLIRNLGLRSELDR